MDLHHVALGLHDAADALHTFVARLGAVVVDGGESVGFRNVQVRVGRPPRDEDPGTGMTVELMEPWASDRFDFLTRFLDARGDGPHHLTFKSDDLRRDLDRFAEAGLEPARARLGDPRWREAFFHPADTYGTVIQVAESNPPADPEADDTGEFEPVAWWPELPPAAPRPAILRRVVFAVPDLEGPTRLFGELLGGTAPDAGARDQPGAATLELRWPGGGRLRFERRGDATGISRLECEGDGLADEELTVGGARVVVRGG